MVMCVAMMALIALADTQGGEIVFTDGTDDLWLVDDGGGGTPVNLTNDAALAAYPAWSPDGMKIVWRSDRDSPGSNQHDLFFLDLLTGAVTPFTQDDLGAEQPAWSADGARIAYKRGGTSDGIRIRDVGDLDGSTDLVLPGASSGAMPAWSPDGARIAYVDGQDIYAIDYNGGAGGVSTNVTNSAGNKQWPIYSPDGTRIAYVWSGHIYTIDAAGLEGPVDETALEPGTHDHPTWSPDGSMLAYWSSDPDPGSIRKIDLVTHVAEEIHSPVSFPNAGPAWRPTLAAPDIALSPTALTFPDTSVGSSSSATFDIISTGTDTLSVTTITSTNAVFTVTTTPPAPFDLAAEDPDLSQTITVTFTPIVEGQQTADITISHNAAGGSTVVTASGSGLAEVTDGVTTVDAQAAAGADVTIPVDIYDTSALDPGVTGIDLTVTYDQTLLTPTSDAGGITSASVTALTTGWSVAQNVVTPGELEIVMGAEFAGELTAGGTILNLTFGVDAAAVTNTTSPVGLSRALLNEGLVEVASEGV